MPSRDAGAGAAAQNSQNQGATAFGIDMPAIQGQLNPSAKTTAALTQLPMQAADAGFEAARANATNRVARTNNSAGYGSTVDKLAMDKAKADSTAALQGQDAIQNLKNEGIKNAGNLFGISEGTIAPLYNAAAANTNASWDWTKGLDAVSNAWSSATGGGKGYKG